MTSAVGAGVAGITVAGADVGEPLLEEQAATNRTSSETPGQKKPARRIRDINIKKDHLKSLDSPTVVSNTYEQPAAVDGIQML
jgi:hypothetical protein